MGRVGESEAESRVVMRGSITEPWRWMESGGRGGWESEAARRAKFAKQVFLVSYFIIGLL